MDESIFDHNLKTRIFPDITLQNFPIFCRMLKNHNLTNDLISFESPTILFWGHFYLLLAFFPICGFSKKFRPNFFNAKMSLLHQFIFDIIQSNLESMTSGTTSVTSVTSFWCFLLLSLNIFLTILRGF